jgi:phosphatidylinositol alpha-mannosyltransferase
LKIGIVTQSYYPKPGGVTEVAHYTAQELRRLGHYVLIITTNYWCDAEPTPGVVRIGKNMIVPVNGAWVNVTVGRRLRSQLAKTFRENDLDLIITHCPLVPTLPLLALDAAERDQRIVGTFHAAAQSNAGYALFRKPLGRRAQRIDLRIAVSEPARMFANRYFPGDYEIIPNGIDCERFNPRVEPLCPSRDNALTILYVGRMDRRKGVPYLLQALPLARKKMKRDIRLIMVGEGKLRGALLHRPIPMNGIEIVVAGRVSPEDLPCYYTSADLFCSPATGRESFGIVLLEAMASGIPVVASDIPGYRRVVSDEQDGLLVAPRDPSSLARAILRLEKDPSGRDELGRNGVEKAHLYDWPAITAKLEKALQRTIGETEPAREPEAIHQGIG